VVEIMKEFSYNEPGRTFLWEPPLGTHQVASRAVVEKRKKRLVGRCALCASVLSVVTKEVLCVPPRPLR
jgi:hypothetical protein